MKVVLAVDRDAEYQIDVVVLQLWQFLRVRLAQTVAGCTAVHADIVHPDAVLGQPLVHDLHDCRRGEVEHGEITAGVLGR